MFKSSYASALKKIIIDESNDCSLLKNNCNDDVEPSRGDIIMSSSQDYDHDTTVNIVNLLDPKNIMLISKLKSITTQHSYPNTAMFHFENYDGLENKVLLCKDLKKAAFKFGTILNIEKTYNISS